MNLNEAGIFTTVITNSTFAIPSGALEIFINNTGSSTCSWIGNRTLPNSPAATPSIAVTLAGGEKFAYGYIGKGRSGFTIDATGTTVELSLTF